MKVLVGKHEECLCVCKACNSNSSNGFEEINDYSRGQLTSAGCIPACLHLLM
jgi:hypothetical protein